MVIYVYIYLHIFLYNKFFTGNKYVCNIKKRNLNCYTQFNIFLMQI